MSLARVALWRFDIRRSYFVRKQFTSMRMQCSTVACAQDLSAFIAARGGGKAGTFISDLDVFHKSHIKSGARRVSGEFYKSLAEWDVGSPTPWVCIALLKAQYTCPKEAVRGRVCSWVASADLAKLAGKTRREEVVEAEELLKLARRFHKDLGFDDPKMLSKLDIAVARALIQKDKAALGLYNAASTFAQDSNAKTIDCVHSCAS